MATPAPTGLRNLEGHTDYDVSWPWVGSGVGSARLRPGTTAVLRVKDEAGWLGWVLPPLLRACDEVLLVDNGSTDDSAGVARATARRCGLEGRLRVVHYPFVVSRAGAEHLATPARSVHSLAYFYNWSFAQVRTRWSWKADGDMVLTPEGEAALGDLAWSVGSVQTVVRMPRHGLFVAGVSRAFVDLGWRNIEEWGFPVGPDFTYDKAPEWEVCTTPEQLRRVALPPGLCVEVKDLAGDEFAHWSDPEGFATSARTARKRREWEVFHALRDVVAAGDGPADPAALPVGVHEVRAPHGVPVVEHVTRTWLPARPRPLLVEDPREDPVRRERRRERTLAEAAALG